MERTLILVSIDHLQSERNCDFIEELKGIPDFLIGMDWFDRKA
jgi:hypothetical protein